MDRVVLNGSGQADYKLGIAQHGDIGIVGRENKLPKLFFPAHGWHHALGDKAVIEIVFRLIDNERRF